MPRGASISLFNDLLCLNFWAIAIHLLLIASTLVVLFIPISAHELDNYQAHIGIYVCMVLTTLIGSYLLVLSNHWLMVYLSIVCMTLAATVLIYGDGTYPHRTLASTQYLLYSTIASTLMLLGLSYLYGSAGTLAIGKLASYHPRLQPFLSILWSIGFFLTLSSLFMTLGSFPFQFWIADVYQRTCFTVVAYLSTVPKIAVIAFMVRLHPLIILSNPSLNNSLQNLWAIIAILTMLIGHLGALATWDAKKLLAYGTIAQTGFLWSFMVTNMSTHTPIIYYNLVYSIMNIASWVGLSLLSYLAKSLSIKDYAGLGQQFPITGICFLLTMLGLIGIPPTAGFTAKLLIFSKLWEIAQASHSPLLISLLVISGLGTILAAYYYLKIPYILFFRTQKIAVTSTSQWPMQLMFIWLTMLLLGLFFTNKMLVSLLDQWAGL